MSIYHLSSIRQLYNIYLPHVCSLCPACLSDLDPLSAPWVIASQDRPACSVRLRQRQFQFRAQHPVLRFLRVNRRKERVCIFVPPVICSREIEVDRGRSEVDSGLILVDLLQVERDIDRRGRLVEIVPVSQLAHLCHSY